MNRPAEPAWPDAALAARLRDRVRAASSARPVLLVDGGSGAGKSTLGAAVVAAWPEALLVHVEDMYPGWDGLDAGSAAVASLLDGADGYRGWDWVASEPADWVPVPPDRPIVVEGSGSLSRASRPHASYAVWLRLDAATRKARALARDGERYAPHWDRWAAQEAAFAARERPESLADEVIDVPV